MRISKLNKLLNLWEKNSLITKEQNKSICDFMKERQKEQFFRLIKWLFILGAFWLVFGFVAFLVQFFDLSFMEKIKEFLIYVFSLLTEPLIKFLKNIFGDNMKFFIWGALSFILSPIAIHFSNKTKISSLDELNLSEGQKQILKNKLHLEIIGCVLLAIGFILFNKLLVPDNINYYDYSQKIFPLWHFLGAVSFIALAYRFYRVSYLIFGLYFVSLSVGMFSGYGYACYWIGASRPVVQALVGIILILIGYITELKIQKEDDIKERFAQTYNWVGLLIAFIALWIMSFWGFDFDRTSSLPQNWELWMSNILFILASITSMYWGAKQEHKVFFNYGLTFLIIESYTLFCSRLWDKLPFALSSLLFGALLILTGKLLIKIYLKQNNKSKN